MKLVVRLINLLALLASAALWGKQGGWDLFISSLVLLAAFLYQDVKVSDGKPTHDEQLYRKFLQDFPSNGNSVRFFKEHDIGVRFRQERLNEFDRFMDTWQNAEHEFKNEYIGSHLRTLISAGRAFQLEFFVHVYSDPDDTWTMDIKDWEDRPEKLQAHKRLNELATDIYKAHQQFVRCGRRLVS